uniref:Global nitrogen transcriptional regulator n=1 Tax=Bangiopsis subsimplex TaxID=139980 RepID=A0A1C9CCR0_9RHOD|nr:global nitrogen transcriptional regulator [Bangiopsis subsimplex]AOM66147.1 global nitrogen transcriptional regulator [Bangiopsis subsimplex]ARO90493.1 global nitrogen transcriptional regulator [Bangiopsis subsimplex]
MRRFGSSSIIRIIEYLCKYNNVNNMLTKVIEFYAKYGELIILDTGDFLIFDQNISYYIWILSGKLHLSKSAKNSKLINLVFLKSNDRLILYNSTNLIYQIKAFEQCHILILNSYLIPKLVTIYPLKSFFILKGITSYCDKIQAFSRIYFPRNVSYRIIILLLLLVKYFGYNSISGIEISLSISQDNIAQIVGTTRVTVTRIFNILQRKKCIEINSNKITIKNLIYLATILHIKNL